MTMYEHVVVAHAASQATCVCETFLLLSGRGVKLHALRHERQLLSRRLHLSVPRQCAADGRETNVAFYVSLVARF